MHHALHGRCTGKGPSQLDLTLDSDGTLVFLAPGWGSMKLKSCEAETFAEAMTFAATINTESMASIMCFLGDALQGQGKVPSQLMLTLNSDGTVGISQISTLTAF